MLGAIIVSPVFIVFSLVWLAIGIFVAVDANKYPDWAFTQTGGSKSTWQFGRSCAACSAAWARL